MVALCDGSLILWPLETERKGDYRVGVLRSFQANLYAARIARAPVAGNQPADEQGRRELSARLGVPLRFGGLRPQLPEEQPSEAALHCASLCGNGARDGCRAVCRAASARREVCRISFRLEDPEGVCAAPPNSGFSTCTPAAKWRVSRYQPGSPMIQTCFAQTHALCFDQSCKGDGYPVALAEAHEQAIVRGAERAAFFHLMERHFVAGPAHCNDPEGALEAREASIGIFQERPRPPIPGKLPALGLTSSPRIGGQGATLASSPKNWGWSGELP